VRFALADHSGRTLQMIHSGAGKGNHFPIRRMSRPGKVFDETGATGLQR